MVSTPPTPPRAGQVWERGGRKRIVLRVDMVNEVVDWKTPRGTKECSWIEKWLAWSRTAKLVEEEKG